MSLAVLADHMASKGRGPDSMLIHMSPREVQGLQALAMKHGGSLSINPETGLPEAGFLDKLLPAVLGFALAPLTAGTSLAFLGATPLASAMTVGALQTLRTGDLGKGIMAGFGAYGGAGLGASLTTAGIDAAQQGAMGALSADQIATEMAQGAFSFDGSGLTQQGVLNQAAADATKSALTNPGSTFSAGFDAATKSPEALGSFAKDNFKNIAYTAAPILADQAVKSNMPTTTTRPGAMRRFSYNPYEQVYTPTGNYEVPVKAAGGGLMGMNDGGYSPGQLNFAERSEPVVRMARGGIAHFEGGGGVNEYDYAPGGGGGDYSVQEGGGVDYFAQQFAPDVFAPAATQAAATQAAAPNYDQVIKDAYATIGRTGVGEGTSQIDQGGYNHFLNMLQTGAAKPEDFGNVFQGAVTRYIADNPNDRYTQYVNDYRANQTGGGAATATDTTGGLTNLAAANNIANVTTGTTGGTNLNAFSNAYTGANINDYIANNALDAAGIATAATKFNVDPAQIVAAQNAQQMVTNVYRNVLGRDPDPAGLSWWTNQIMNGDRTGAEMYESFKESAKSLLGSEGTKEIFKDLSLADATKEYGGYQSADKRTIADEWVRNTLGREVTDADRKTQWYKDAANSGVMTTVGKAEDIYSKFKNFARDDAAATAAKKIADAKTLLTSKGLSEMDVLRQTGKTIAELVGSDIKLENDLFKASQLLKPGQKAGFDFNTITKPKALTTTQTVLDTNSQTNAPAGTRNPYGNINNPGDLTFNADGTTTVTPNIPGRPYGGFSGMGEVKNAYTQGGGSLGYIPYAPKTIEEFDEKYNTLTGGSKEAYDRLTGKTKYSPIPYTETGEVMKPYAESVLGVPTNISSKKVLFDPVTKKYKNNPDYIPVSYTAEGKKVYGLSSKDIAAQLPDVATSDYEKWTKDNNVTLAQIAEALNISLAEAKKRYPKLAGKASTTTDDTANTGGSYDGGGGMATGGLMAMAGGGMAGQFDLGGYSDGGRLLRGPGDGVSDSIPATIGNKRPARLADGEFVVPARIVSELGNGSTEAGARKLYAMMDRVQRARRGTVGKGRVAKNSRADKHLPA